MTRSSQLPSNTELRKKGKVGSLKLKVERKKFKAGKIYCNLFLLVLISVISRFAGQAVANLFPVFQAKNCIPHSPSL